MTAFFPLALAMLLIAGEATGQSFLDTWAYFKTSPQAAHYARASNGMALPDPEATPGLTRPLTRRAICSTAWGLDHRHVTESMKTAVCARYHVRCTLGPHGFEIDHLIPRELGGADDLLNLWPQMWSQARVKDRIENQLHRDVCAGRIPLERAQEAIRTDWTRLIPRSR